MSTTNVSDIALARMQTAIWELQTRVDDLAALVAANLPPADTEPTEQP